jgi:hypothetical protein
MMTDIQIPTNEESFRFLDDRPGVAILLYDTDQEMAEILFWMLPDEGWSWVIEGQQTDFPSEWQMPLAGPQKLPTLQQCVDDAIEFLKLYSSKTNDNRWEHVIDKSNAFLMANTPPAVINTRKQRGPGVCSHGYDMEV